MNQEELKQRLIELLKESKLCSKRFDDQYSDGTISIIADHLIANGVTIRERGEWVKPSLASETNCSRCGRTSKMLFGYLSEFCPHCGADMRGVKDDA